MTVLRTTLMGFTRIKRVRVTCIISRDGFMNRFVMPADVMDPCAPTIMNASFYDAATKMSEELKRRSMDLLTVENAINYILLQDLDEVVFAIVADKTALLGRIRCEEGC